MADAGRIVAVCGATGRQGGAVTRHLLRDGWTVRALTRRPDAPKAKALAGEGADVIAADMDDPASLGAAFRGAAAVFSVQNGQQSGFEREVTQGRNVADAAKGASVPHLVYASTGPAAQRTGVASWDAKFDVERHIRDSGITHTFLRPTAFMELMTDRGYYPNVGTWRIWPRLTGDDRPIPWFAVDDVGRAVARVLAEPASFAGRAIDLVGDVQSLAACRALYEDVHGRRPPTFPLPMWLFDRFTRGDVTAMWRWLRTGTVPTDTGPAAAVVGSPTTVREWLERGHASAKEKA